MKKIQALAYAPIAIGASAGKGVLKFMIASLCYVIACSPLSAQQHSGPKPITAPAVALAKGTASAVALAKQTASAVALAEADSLFKLKQFTQSFEIYNRLFHQKKYSPAMLLKMAYIQDGLGHLSQSLFFLNLYYQASHDEQALAKIKEVAAKNKLEGYTPSESTTALAFLKENYFPIAGIIISIVCFLLAMEVYRKRMSKKIIGLVLIQIFFLAVLFIHINFATSIEQGIVTGPSTYLMSGPSAGASVVSIIPEGNQLEIVGHSDVWLKVKWMDKIAYVKENSVLPVHL